MMGVNDRRAVFGRGARDGTPERGPKSGRSPERRHGDALRLQSPSPGARFVKATDGRRDGRAQPRCELEHQPLGAAGIQAQDDLEDSWGGRRLFRQSIQPFIL
jgi:hypothetical protein